MKALRLAVSLAVCASVAAAPVSAQQRPPLSCYVAEFLMEPMKLPASPVWIPEGDPIFEARLLPKQLWEVGEAVQVGGLTLLRPGDQLLGMRSNIPTRCNFPQMKDNSIAARERICVFDPDGDGRFDQIHSRSRGGDIWFAMAWEHPKEDVLTIQPVVMNPIVREQFKGGPRIKYNAYHIPLRRKPRDGSPPYYEAFTEASLRGNDGLLWRMYLSLGPYGGNLLSGSVVDYGGLRIKVEEVAAEKTLISYSGNFGPDVIKLPFLNSYQEKCDIMMRDRATR